jgi:glycosyltransferase involved in cell wall biosynthesis
MVLSGLVNYMLSRYRNIFSPSLRSQIDEWVHSYFSKVLERNLPGDFDFFIGLSSFCKEALEKCKSKGIPCAVDHGSLHMEENLRFIKEEGERWSVSVESDNVPEWVIEKQNREYETADHLFVLSSVAKESMIKNGVEEKKIFVNPCGVDLSSFYVKESDPEPTFRVLQTGGITLGKGVLTLLEAFNDANLDGSELHFVGGGYNTCNIRAHIDKKKRRNTFFHEPVPQNELIHHYHKSSVFVLASVSDGFGMVVPQAMACGLPVIVTQNVGAKDLIVDGHNGFIVPVGSPDQIAEKLRVLYKEPELRARLGKNARKTVEEGYSWKDYGDRLSAFIRDNTTPRRIVHR